MLVALIAQTNRNEKFMKLKILAFAVALTLATNLPAQTFTTLHSFTGGDGAAPWAGLVLSGNSLYGTTANGGSSSNGTVFRINTDGSDFTILHSFTVAPGSYPYYTNNDGANPYAGLTLSGNILFGTTSGGGA